MLIRKIYLTTFICLLLISSVSAQFDIRFTSALGKLSFNPKTSLNINIETVNFITAGIQIDYYLTENFGVGIGADYYIRENQFNAILSNYSHIYEGMDNWDGDPILRKYDFTIKSNAPNIVEQNTISLLDFPVSLIYKYPIINNIFLAARLGIKMGLPINNNSYILKESDLYTRLYFEEWDLELFNIPAHGLYDSRTDWHPEGELNLNKEFSVFSELGVDFPLSLLKVRLSGYLAYGLNNISNNNQSSLIYWREDYNNILSLPESVKMMQIGVKLGVGLITDRDERSEIRRNRQLCPAYQ
ncbi:MAG: hypothetical protein IPF54_21915 [Draconibacterium sp.]|nr:hypothetical protein [Draconibacterium sp.]